MTLRTDIFDRCTTHAGTAALIGTRCYPAMLPEEPVYPAMTYGLVSDVNAEYRTHDTGPVPRTVSRVQLDIYAATGDASSALADQLRLAWSGYKDDCTIGWAQVANLIDAGWNDNLKRWRHIMDVRIEHPIVT